MPEREESVTERCTIAVMLTPLLVLALMQAPAHSQAKDMRTPPKVVPASCSMVVLASAGQKTGSELYVALSYQIAALVEAEDAVGNMDKAVKEIDAATTPASMMSKLLSAATTGEDQMHCAAYLLGQWHPTTVDLQNLAALLIDVYNRKAKGIAATSDRAKRQFLRVDKPQTRAEELALAEQQAASGKEVRQASTDLLDYTTFTVMMAVDISDQKAAKADYLTLSCSERTDILERSTKLRGEGNVDGDDFRAVAGLIATGMREHKCHEAP